MKAEKVMVTIKMEALSIDVLGGLLAQVIDHIEGGVINGEMGMDDGDVIVWNTESESVEF